MLLKSIQISNFRNISSAKIDFNDKINIVVGANGQGKTNLVESIFLALRGHSFRFAKNIDFVEFEKEIAAISGNITSRDLTYDFQTLLTGQKKTHFINRKLVPFTKTSTLFPIVLFSPESLASIKGGAEERRALLDEFLLNIQPTYSGIFEEFNRSMRARNKVLKSLQQEDSQTQSKMDILTSITPSYLQLAIEVTKRRIEAIHILKDDFLNAAQALFGQIVDISVEYVASSQNLEAASALEIEKNLIDRAHQLERAEIASGTSLVGPQKHDIRFLYGNKDSRIFCSQGQQRALILAFKIAQIVYHKRALKVYPILVLDDVLSELDRERRESLIQFLGKIQTQIFITTTDDVEGLDQLGGTSSVIRVSSGKFEWSK